MRPTRRPPISIVILTALFGTVTAPVCASADPPPLRVGPVAGEIEARVRESRSALAQCRAALAPREVTLLASVTRAVLPIGYGNAVSDLRFEPASPALESYRTCLRAVVRRWQISRPETHEPAEVVVEGADLRRIVTATP